MENCNFITEVFSGNELQTCSFQVLILEGISIPEDSAEAAEKSRAMLESLVLNRKISYEEKGRDEYGRIIARVSVAGRSVNGAIARLVRKISGSRPPLVRARPH